MFEQFHRHFGAGEPVKHEVQSPVEMPRELRVLEQLAGRVYRGGLYRTHATPDLRIFTEAALDVFPDLTGCITCFASDWLGRQFALDLRRQADGHQQILMLEPGTGERLAIPRDLEKFHDAELVQFPDAALASEFFEKWLQSGGQAPLYSQCIGYKRPLYLGGADNCANLEICDFEVYWGLAAQLLEKVRNLPVGTRVQNFSIEG
jgi:hypothetical protein